MPREKLPHDATTVYRPPIPEQDDRSEQMAQQQAEKAHDLLLRDVGQVVERVETAPLAARTDRHRRDRGHLVMRVVAMAQEGRVPSRRPRAPDRGNQQKAALVKEYQMGVQAVRFFLMATQR